MLTFFSPICVLTTSSPFYNHACESALCIVGLTGGRVYVVWSVAAVNMLISCTVRFPPHFGLHLGDIQSLSDTYVGYNNRSCTVRFPPILCLVYFITHYTCQWRIQETGKGGSKVSSAKREELNPRKARKIWGYAHFRCSKTRENPILSQGKSHLRHLRLRGT